MMSLVTLILMSYLVFVFFSEGFNPLMKPRSHGLGPRWRHGRRMGLAALMGGLCVIALLNLTGLTFYFALAAGLMLSAVLASCFSIARIRKFLTS